MTSAKVICDSISPYGSRLITMEIELHRFVLPEFNTHRCFSRNFQSSRAVPVSGMIEQVRNNPAMPVHWGANQRGMVAEEAITEREQIVTESIWECAAEAAADAAEDMMSKGVHKQITNRLLEPFMWTRGVVTATYEGFQSFFKLRCHPDAQPEIKALAEEMEGVLYSSTPDQLQWGEYHLPYVSREWCPAGSGVIYGRGYAGENRCLTRDILSAVKVSSSCCAQVSYRVLDDSLDKANKIYDMLNLPSKGHYPDAPPHFSPTEHVAYCADADGLESTDTGNFGDADWWQYRKALEKGEEETFIN